MVVTGVGLVTPFGAGREISWSAIRHGQSAVRWLDADDLNGALVVPGEDGAEATLEEVLGVVVADDDGKPRLTHGLRIF